jgi:hypothetical protein
MTYTDLTREHLADCIRPAMAKMDVFAKELGITRMTLRIRLSEEGTSWTDIQHAEIQSRVAELRAQGVCDSDISDELGYANRANFARAMRRMAEREVA